LSDRYLLRDRHRVREVLVREFVHLVCVIWRIEKDAREKQRISAQREHRRRKKKKKEKRTFGDDEGVTPRQGIDVQEGVTAGRSAGEWVR
jgi:hypothetical protein